MSHPVLKSTTYPEIDDANFKGVLSTSKKWLAFKMLVYNEWIKTAILDRKRKRFIIL